MKSKEDMPDTSVSLRYVTPPGSNRSPSAPPIQPKTEDENVRMKDNRNNVGFDAAPGEEG